MNNGPQEHASSKPVRGMVWPTVFAAAVLAVLIGLGTWQFQRLEWKNDLIATVGARIAADPAPLPASKAWPSLDPATLEYRPFVATGVFDHAHELYVFIHLPEARGRLRGAGYWVVTPLVLTDGSVVLVNRGFVPEAFREPATRAAGQIGGVVTVTGLLRKPEVQTSFVPDNDPERNIWFYRDPAAMARASGHPAAAPFLLDERANEIPGGLPQAGETRLVFKNAHFQYALTWYGLALCLAGVYAAFWIGHRRQQGNQV